MFFLFFLFFLFVPSVRKIGHSVGSEQAGPLKFQLSKGCVSILDKNLEF